jgi:uroporphyrinogen decarboxylase
MAVCAYTCVLFDSALPCRAWEQPYADKVIMFLKQRHPGVPVVYYANGGSAYLHKQLDMSADSIALDWRVSMQHARDLAGPQRVLTGNVDPSTLYCSKEVIRATVADTIHAARGNHVLNLGHGVEQDTPEAAIHYMVEACHDIRL